MRSIVDYVMIFKGRGLKMGVFVGGGGGGGGVDLDLDYKNFWDGVYNFFFCPPLDEYCIFHRENTHFVEHEQNKLTVPRQLRNFCSSHATCYSNQMATSYNTHRYLP